MGVLADCVLWAIASCARFGVGFPVWWLLTMFACCLADLMFGLLVFMVMFGCGFTCDGWWLWLLNSLRGLIVLVR